MVRYRIFLGVGIVFAIVASAYAWQTLFSLLLMIWTLFSICAPVVFRDARGTLLSVYGAGMTSLGAYLTIFCLIESFRSDVHLFYPSGPTVSAIWLIVGVLLAWFGFALTIGGIISADRKGNAP